MYRIKFDGNYVKECDYEFLKKCKKEESVFSDSIAQSIKKQCPDRVEIEKVKEE
jgi:predicted CopG family antitoxin